MGKPRIAKAKKTSILILSLSIVLAFFVMFNGQDVNLKVSMGAYALIGAIMILFINGGTFKNLNLIDGVLDKDVFIGLGVGVGLIFLNQATNLTMGIPLFVGLEEITLFTAVVLVAPVFEEWLFRSFLLSRLQENFGKVVSVVAQAVLFSLFHLVVYGEILGLINAPGLFVGAGIVGLIFGFLVADKDFTDLESVIIPHMIFNFWILNMTGVLFSIAI